METRVGSGRHTYEVHDDWMRLPPEVDVLAASVTVDSHDNVYCFSRSKEHPVVVFDREGNFVRSWGAGLFAFPHTIRADENDNLWIVDRDHGQMMLFTTAGECLRTIGTKGFRSDTGLPPEAQGRSDSYKQVTHGGAPFNLPTDIAVAPSGEMFVSDGYGNARVHKFSPEGKLLKSWGEPGSAPGEFNLPHGVWIDRRGRLLVADRENDRVQVFDQDGRLLGVWPTKLIGPAVITWTTTTSSTSSSTTQARERAHARRRTAGAVGRSGVQVLPRRVRRFPRRPLRRARRRVGA